MVNKLKDAANFLKNKFQTDQLDQKLSQAVSQDNWQASTQLLHQIANASYNKQKQQKIIMFINDKLTNKSWKKILKTLHLIDFLIKYGPTSIINNFKQNIYEFRKLQDYQCKSQGIDRGQSIRKQSKLIINILSDQSFLQQQRIKAKNIKQKMSTVIGGGAYLGNFSSSGSTSNNDNYYALNNNNFTTLLNTSKYVSSTNGNTFGQMVMKQLNQKKKLQNNLSPKIQKKQQKPKIGPNQLNLANMNIKKPQNNNNFNNLSKKLTKPSQKHIIAPVKIEKTQQKNNNIFDIVNFDINNAQKPINQANNQMNSLDLLGFSQVKQNSNNIEFDLFKQQPSKVNNIYIPPQINNNNIKIDLKTNEKTTNINKDLNNLIDFSDFKSELNSISTNKQADITTNWNW